MPSYSGNYGKASIGSEEVAEVGSWWVELTSVAPPLKEWAGSCELAWDAAQVVGVGETVTLTLYQGDDGEEPSLSGQAIIGSVVFGEAGEPIGAPFQGTGPLYLVEDGERQVL